MDAPACTLCDDHGDCIAVRSDGEEIRACRGCGLVFTSSRPDRDATQVIAVPRNSVLDRMARHVRQHREFVLRYKLGRIVSAKNRPQTIIVVARRRD